MHFVHIKIRHTHIVGKLTHIENRKIVISKPKGQKSKCAVVICTSSYLFGAKRNDVAKIYCLIDLRMN